MNLLELRESFPGQFYPQTWWDGEEFARIPAPVLPGNDLFAHQHKGPHFDALAAMRLPHAVTLAAWYVFVIDKSPAWEMYLWTRDLDGQGQRVYVGQNGKGFEVHRHLHLTDRWGVPRWG